MLAAVGQLYLLYGSRHSRVLLQFLYKAGAFQHLVNGLQTQRAFRVFRPHVMQDAICMGDKSGGHGKGTLVIVMALFFRRRCTVRGSKLKYSTECLVLV